GIQDVAIVCDTTASSVLYSLIAHLTTHQCRFKGCGAALRSSPDLRSALSMSADTVLDSHNLALEAFHTAVVMRDELVSGSGGSGGHFSFGPIEWIVSMSNCRFENTSGEGIIIEGGYHLVVDSCTFSRNKGSGLRVQNSGLTVSNTVFEQNGASALVFSPVAGLEAELQGNTLVLNAGDGIHLAQME